jgi:hypothetical protein
MKATFATIQMFLLLLAGAGCEPPKTELTPANGTGLNQLAEYTPAKVDILPLTEFTREAGKTELKVYVSLLDEFGCQIKSPAVFRFELHNKVPRSAEPKGKRVAIWPDINLSDHVKNNEHWQDFLRSYKFDLPFQLEADQSYVLQATALCPNGKRLSAEFALTYKD